MVARREKLERLWGMLRRSLLLKAGVAASGIDGDIISHGKNEGKAPAMHDAAGDELRYFEGRWANCKSDKSRLDVLKDLAIATGNGPPKPNRQLVPHTKEWREAVAADVRGSRRVGKTYGISHTLVCRFRSEFPALRPPGGVK